MVYGQGLEEKHKDITLASPDISSAVCCSKSHCTCDARTWVQAQNGSQDHTAQTKPEQGRKIAPHPRCLAFFFFLLQFLGFRILYGWCLQSVAYLAIYFGVRLAPAPPFPPLQSICEPHTPAPSGTTHPLPQWRFVSHPSNCKKQPETHLKLSSASLLEGSVSGSRTVSPPSVS